MKSAKSIKILVCTFLFLFILAICVSRISDILQRKDSDFKYKPFFEQKEDFDVLFMGTSHVINGIFPMELWNDYGIVSYNFGGHGNRIPTSYWIMQNVLDYTKPRLIVLDILFVDHYYKNAVSEMQTHMSLDCFPLSKTKMKSIFDIFGFDMEYIFDFIKYHSRWKELNKNEFTNEKVSREKGAESRIAVAVPNEYALVPKNVALENETVGTQYLRKMIEDCQSKNIEVLLVYLPYPADKDAQIAANTVYAIAEEYGVNYINFVAMDNVVDYNTDCYDIGSHLNPSGARKVSDYLGKYIKDHYDIPDRRDDEKYNSWFVDYEDYVDYKIGNINAQTNIENVLMLLSDKDFSACVYFKEDSPLLERENISALLENMAGQKLPQQEEAVNEETNYCLIVDHEARNIWESAGKELDGLETSFGKVSFSIQNGIPNLQIQSEEANILYGDWCNSESDVPEPDAQIFVIDNRTKEIVSTSRWDFEQRENVAKRKD